MKFIDNILLNDPDYSLLLQSIEKGRMPVACTGLSSVHKAVILSSLLRQTGKKIAVLTQDEASANEFLNDALALGINAVNFPLRDYCIDNLSGYSKEYERARTDTLSKLLDGDFDVLTVSAEAALQTTLPPDVLKRASFVINQGDSIEIFELIKRFNDAGYVKSDICEGEGQFSIRGGIVDIFPISYESPCRIEFWGDEIDNISFFDLETQRRTDTVNEINIKPAGEIICDFNTISDIL